MEWRLLHLEKCLIVINGDAVGEVDYMVKMELMLLLYR